MGFWEDITGVTAAKEAAAAQTEGIQLGIDEQRAQFAEAKSLVSPYIQAGTGALEQQQALSGALGPEAQQAAIAGIQAGPGFQSALQQGETSILQNAAATGGLRGGNTQAALAQFSPQLLQQAIGQQYGQLGGLSGMGMQAASGLGSAGMGMGQDIAGSLAGIGDVGAQEALGGYNLQKGFVGDIFGGLLGLGDLGVNIAGLF